MSDLPKLVVHPANSDLSEVAFVDRKSEEVVCLSALTALFADLVESDFSKVAVLDRK